MEIGIEILHTRSFVMEPGEIPASGYTGVRPEAMKHSVLEREEAIRRKIYDLVHNAIKPILFGRPYEVDKSTSYEVRIEKRIPYQYMNVKLIRFPEHREKAVSPIIRLTWRERFRALFKGEFHMRTP